VLGDWVLSFRIDGRPPMAPSDQPNTNYYAVTPAYFPAMGIRLVRGRLFTARDDAAAPHVAIINETFARQRFPNEDPLGKRVEISAQVNSWSEIVGMVNDVTQYGVDKITPSQAYEPFAQKPYGTFHVVIRTSDSTDAVQGSLRPAIYAVDKNQPIGSIVPLKDVMAESLETQRFAMLLLTTFSGIALVIAAVGIYGVMAYSVAQRTGEFGIRMALGAQRGDVLQLVLAQGGRLIGLGLLIGLAATIAAARAIESMLFRTSTHDPVTLVAIMVLLGVVALVACLYPALRATKVDPMEALRAE
jgi:putative ABC transport system permease protein